MSTEDGGFFSRWSYRKAQVRSGEPVPVGPASRTPTATSPLVAGQAETALVPPVVPTAIPDPVPEAAKAERPPLTLDDVQQLTPEADFRPFVSRDVAPEVRNAAFKKLFADPQFNVMDGLDIYIDDYSQPDPLPVSLARKLMSAQTLGLFDEPKAEVPHAGLEAPAPVAVVSAPLSPEPDPSNGAGPDHPATDPPSTPDAPP